MSNAYKLLVVDDSKIMRDAITSIFDDDLDIEVVGSASNGVEALKAIEELQPNCITMDVSMPVMDGISTLKHVMIRNPISVVMLSSFTTVGSSITFDALRYGAVDFISKPAAADVKELQKKLEEIRHKIKFAADVEVESIKYIRNYGRGKSVHHFGSNENCRKVVVMGAGEGGYGALLKLIPQLRADQPAAYIVTMYAAPEHVDAFTAYLNDCSAVRVQRAEHNEVIQSGVCYLCAGEEYTTLDKQADGRFSLHVNPAPFKSRRGTVDMLLFSVADILAENCLGIILSGAGSDGTEGLEEVVRMGGSAIVQDPKSCLSEEMPVNAQLMVVAAKVIADVNVAAGVHDYLEGKTEWDESAHSA